VSGYHYPRHIRALALDMATKTGYAILEDGQVRGGVYEVKRRKGRRHLADEHEGKEYADFQAWLARIVAKVQPQAIFYELPSMFKNPKTGYKPIAFRGFLMAEAARGSYPVYGYHITSVKKTATGNGHAGKAEMIEAAKQQFPQLEILDDNMADALHVLSYGLAAKMGIETLRFGM
jgi:Holliday junction resolvasome RuvABC endonuclease subunit